jgi:hypothetical protein
VSTLNPYSRTVSHSWSARNSPSCDAVVCWSEGLRSEPTEVDAQSQVEGHLLFQTRLRVRVSACVV